MFRLFNFFWFVFDNCQTLDKEIWKSKKTKGFYNLTGMLGFLSIGFIITIVASFAIVYFDNHRPPAELRLYNVESGKTMYVNTYDDILPNSEKVGKWVQNIVPRLFKYDFLNIDKNLDNNKKYFSEKEAERFTNMIKNGPLYKEVKDLHIDASLFLLDKPRLLNERYYPLLDKYGFLYEVSGILVKKGATKTVMQKVNMDIYVTTDKNDNLTNPHGLLINHLKAAGSE